MTITNIILIATSAAFALTGTALVLKAGRLRKEAEKLNEESFATLEKAAEALRESIAQRLKATPPLSVSVESISANEFFNALDAADLPTPGCGCKECDARRLRKASKQA